MSDLVKVPRYSDLISKSDSDYKNDELNLLLNTPPPNEWIKKHPYIKNHNYLPIDKVEYLLRAIFGQYKIEITGQGHCFNGVWVTVRVHYLNPITKEWMWHDGIGSIELQVKSGHSASDLANINKGALSMAFPIAKTFAIKDACDMFGKLFGSDLNRDNSIDYFNAENPIDKETVETALSSILNSKDLVFVKDKANEFRLLMTEQQKKQVRDHIASLTQ